MKKEVSQLTDILRFTLFQLMLQIIRKQLDICRWVGWLWASLDGRARGRMSRNLDGDQEEHQSSKRVEERS